MTKAIDILSALKIIAAKICGDNLGYVIDKKNNTIKIVATKNGVFVASENRLQKYNNISNLTILNCIFPYSFVSKNQVVAELFISPYSLLDDIDSIIFNISGNSHLLSVIEIPQKRISIISTSQENTSSQINHNQKTTKKIIDRTTFLKTNFAPQTNALYIKEDLDSAIYTAQKSGSNLIFIASSVKNKDVINEVICLSFNNILCTHFPEIGLNDITIASKENLQIIVLPYNYANIDSFNLDALINKAILTPNLITTDFMPQAPIVLNKTEIIKKEEDIFITNQAKNKKNKNLAGIILAAGFSHRAKTNKLLIKDKNQKPLFLRAISEAIKTGISPIFVVLGHRHKELEEYLSNLDINVIINKEYSYGVKSSIELGIKALPDYCDGVFLIPADMPYITANHLEAMIKKFDNKKEKQVVTSSANEIQKNPIIWSKALFEYADLVPENSTTRPFFLSHKDYVKTVKTTDAKILDDITHPVDVTKFLDLFGK